MSSTKVLDLTSNISEQDAWLASFKIPLTFSERTMDCISTGILTQASRTEITQMLATLMRPYTHNPSSVAYTTVCRKLIEVHPTLADEDEPKYVSFVHIEYTNAIKECHFSCTSSSPGSESLGTATSFWGDHHQAVIHSLVLHQNLIKVHNLCAQLEPRESKQRKSMSQMLM